MAKINELSFTIKPESLTQWIEILKDLSRLNDKVLMKIDQENTLIYSLVGDNNIVNSFKNFVFKTDFLFNDIGTIDGTINYIIKSAKQMFRILQIISSFDMEVSGKIYFDDIGDSVFSDRINIKVGNKLRHNFYGDNPTSMNTKITIDKIKGLADKDDADFSFDLSADDFDKLKKLSTPEDIINIFYLNVFGLDGKNYVSIGEGTWDITVAETEYKKSSSLAFPKKYFKSINMVDGSARVYVFERMILVVTENSNLIISVEVSV